MARYIDADKLRERDFGDFGYEMRYEIDRTPTEDVRPVVRGKWIEEPNCWLRCSCCKSHYPHTSINGVRGSNYCPNCGADMREVEE